MCHVAVEWRGSGLVYSAWQSYQTDRLINTLASDRPSVHCCGCLCQQGKRALDSAGEQDVSTWPYKQRDNGEWTVSIGRLGGKKYFILVSTTIIMNYLVIRLCDDVISWDRERTEWRKVNAAISFLFGFPKPLSFLPFDDQVKQFIQLSDHVWDRWLECWTSHIPSGHGMPSNLTSYSPNPAQIAVHCHPHPPNPSHPMTPVHSLCVTPTSPFTLLIHISPD